MFVVEVGYYVCREQHRIQIMVLRVVEVSSDYPFSIDGFHSHRTENDTRLVGFFSRHIRHSSQGIIIDQQPVDSTINEDFL